MAFFYHLYVWVNDGSWQSSSPEQRAITSAHVAAQREGIETYNADILIRRVPCRDNHVNVCQHIIVAFQLGECSP